MATVTIDYQVFMTHCHSLSEDKSIGTDGLAGCVGIIATKKGGGIFCGHLACSILGKPQNENAIRQKTAILIQDQLGGKDEIENVYCATSNLRDKASKWMIESITKTYSKVSYKEGNGIYWDKGKPVITQFGTDLSGITKGDDSNDGPFEVKN